MPPSHGRRVHGPCFDLEAFKTELRAGNYHVYRTRAANVIQKLLGCGSPRAERFARDVVLSLNDGDFAHSIQLPNGQKHDVYGKLLQEEGWYVKIEIHIRDGEPGIVSCHPAEYDVQTRKGIVPRSRRGETK